MSDNDSFEQLVDSFVDRYRRGERPSISEYVRKYPLHAQRIQQLFPTLAMMEQLAPDDDQSVGTNLRETFAREGLEQLGDYRLLRQVGSGGMGVVYEAEQESLGRHVALKVLPWNGIADSNQLKRFRREARAAARLHHTNIVPVFDVGEAEGFHYYAMQFIHGQALDEVIRELRAFRDAPREVTSTPTESAPSERDSLHYLLDNGSSHSATNQRFYQSAAHVGAQAADALAHAHEQGILHRDVKPSNLMLDTDGHVWVTDFGLAKTDAKEDLTHTGDLVGTLRYMAPERFDGWSDPRSDIYGLGLTLYELTTLHPPFPDTDRHELIRRVLHEEPLRPRRRDRNIPSNLELIILKSIAKEPAQRYLSAQELANDLRRFLVNEPIVARRTTVWERSKMWCRRNPLVAGLSSAILALLIAVAIGASVAAFWLGRERDLAVANYNRAVVAEHAASESATRERASRVAAVRSLYESKLSQARAARWSGRMGRRFESLAALKEAAALAKKLQLGESHLLDLRNEVIASLALVDLQLDREWPLDGPRICRAVAFDPNVERFARLEADGFVVVRSMETAEQLGRLPCKPELPVSGSIALKFSPCGEYLAVKTNVSPEQNVLSVWQWATGTLLLQCPIGGRSFQTNFDFSPDSRHLILGESHTAVRYELASGEAVSRYDIEQTSIHLAYHPDGTQLAVVEECFPPTPNAIRIVDLESSEITATLQAANCIDVAVWSSDGQTLLAPCHDFSLYSWAMPEGTPSSRFRGHQAQVTHVDLSPASDLIVSSGWEPMYRLWDTDRGEQLLATRARLGRFSRDGRWLSMSEKVSGQRSTGRYLVNPAHECRQLEAFGRKSAVISLDFGPDGRMLAAASRGVGVQIWDSESGRLLIHLPVQGQCGSVCFLGSDQLITYSASAIQQWHFQEQVDRQAASLTGPPITLWENSNATPLPWIETAWAHGNSMLPSGFLAEHVSLEHWPNGRFLAVVPHKGFCVVGAKWRQTIEVRSLESGDLLAELATPLGSLVRVSPDGEWLVGSLGMGRFRIWNCRTWKLHREIDLQGNGFGQTAFLADGQVLAVTDTYSVVLLEADTGRILAKLESPHDDRLTQTYPEGAPGIAFSDDGAKIAVGSFEGSLKVWDLRAIRSQLASLGLDWSLR